MADLQKNVIQPGRGRVEPERVKPPGDETPDIDGIEIDNAIERPKEGQPGQRGPKEPD